MKHVREFFRQLASVFTLKIEQSAQTTNGQGVEITQTAIVQNFMLVAIVLAVALIALGAWIYHEYQQSTYDLSPMTGSLNVAVAQFADWTHGGCGTTPQTGALIANAFYSRLESDRQNDKFYSLSSGEMEVRSPRGLPSVRGGSEEELAISAEQLAARINAHIIIYGVITCSTLTAKPSFQVMFYVAPASFSDAQELIGEFSFNSDLLYGEVVPGEDFLDLNKNLRQKVEVISLLVKSIASYWGEDYPLSLASLSKAMDSSLWESQEGNEVLYILAGNAETRYAHTMLVQGESAKATEAIESARADYNRANRLTNEGGRGNYGRAYVGLAGVENFYAVRDSVITNDPRDIDTAALDRESNMLRLAETATYSPTTADVLMKVAFDRAQLELTLYELKLDRIYLNIAEGDYRSVVNAYSDGNIRVREMAGHSYAGLAIISRLLAQPNDAEGYYRLAITTTRVPSLQAQYMLQLGNTYCEAGDEKDALAFYQETWKRKNDLAARVPASTILDLQNRISAVEKDGRGACVATDGAAP